jgi:RND family efflux transporter MFP subunit
MRRAAVVAAALLSTALWAMRPRPARPAAPAAIGAPTAIEPVTAAPLAGDSGFIGVIVAGESAEVAPSTPARVLRVAVRIGEAVARGGTLAELDRRALRADQAMAEAALAAAAAQRDKARVEADYAAMRLAQQQRGAVELGPRLQAVSPAELTQAVEQEHLARQQLAIGVAAVAEKRARLQQVAAQLSDCVVRAPFDGVVAERYVDDGALVGPSSPLVRLIRRGEPRVRFAVPDAAAATLTIGRRLRVQAGGAVVAAVVERVAPDVEPASRTIVAEGRLDGATTLREGTVVHVFAAEAP